jgi:UDP-N-acetylmuramoyl-tripeptide--D-alanyl-D-alanine ligase
LVIGRLNILDDTYNANPDSMEAALHALAEIPVSSGARRIAVLGEMGELGAHAGEGYARVGKTSAACVHVLITVGVDAAPMGLAARKAGLRDVFSVEHTSEAATLIRSIARAGDLVLLKGSRSARMEQILPLLEPSSAQ